MADGQEIRAQIDTETVRGLQLMNGGMAAGLVTLLPAIIREPGYEKLGAWMTGAIICGAMGLVCSVIHNRLRRKCSLEYSKKDTREPPYRWRVLVWMQSVPAEPRVCTRSVIFMWCSLISFFVGALCVGTGFWRTWAFHPDPTASCWTLSQIDGIPVRFNSCTGRFEPVALPQKVAKHEPPKSGPQ